MKVSKVSIEELIKLIKNQLERVEEKYKYEKEFKKLYKKCKKPILLKIKEYCNKKRTCICCNKDFLFGKNIGKYYCKRLVCTNTYPKIPMALHTDDEIGL